MTTYEMQRCLFDHLRRLENSTEPLRPDQVLTDGYDLTEAERAALSGPDVGALYDLGAHPVFVNAFCRAMGWKKADYAVLFADDLADQMRNESAREARWMTGRSHG